VLAGTDRGSGDTIRARAAELGVAHVVRFVDAPDDASIVKLLHEASVLAYPSLYEGFGLPVLEAMASGLPVIATNVEGIRDVVTHALDGFLVDPGDMTALKSALVRLVQDAELRERLGKAGRSKAVASYSLQRCVAQYERLFISLLAG